MKPLLVAVLLFFAAPGAAFAGASLTMREVPLHGERTLAAATPEFDLVGLHWLGSGAVSFERGRRPGSGARGGVLIPKRRTCRTPERRRRVRRGAGASVIPTRPVRPMRSSTGCMAVSTVS